LTVAISSVVLFPLPIALSRLAWVECNRHTVATTAATLGFAPGAAR
jgi:hypothetical protein